MTDGPETSVSALLAEARRGESAALQRLFPLVYDELRHLARTQRRRQAKHETLNTTALVHEAFLRLTAPGKLDLNDRAHFMAVAATAMRQILISYSRRRSASKRGGGVALLKFDELEAALASEPGFSDAKAEALVVLDDALGRLESHSARQSRVVECRVFGGMSVEETATALSISPATVKREWAAALAWLYREMREELV
jgi:RNA polymerase sigma factor (TIGR02999 family)